MSIDPCHSLYLLVDSSHYAKQSLKFKKLIRLNGQVITIYAAFRKVVKQESCAIAKMTARCALYK